MAETPKRGVGWLTGQAGLTSSKACNVIGRPTRIMYLANDWAKWSRYGTTRRRRPGADLGGLRTRQRGGEERLRVVVRAVADSDAIVWYGHDSPKLSDRAREALDDAVASDGVILSIVTLVELWYVTQTTRGVSQEELDAISEQVSSSPHDGLLPRR